MEPLAAGAVGPQRPPGGGRIKLLLAIASVVAVGSALTMLQGQVERGAVLVTLRLALEVTVLCLLLGIAPTYFVLRRAEMLGRGLVALALASLIVPTIARSLALGALFSYYGPVASSLRAMGLWAANRPLDSSHAAVVAALVTLYLPIVVLITATAARGLGRIPDVASTLGARPLTRCLRVVLPALASAVIASGLVVFGQVLGVIVTPRILGSGDLTVALLIDDLLKRSLDPGGAVRLAVAQLALAAPLAVAAGLYLRDLPRSGRRPLRPVAQSSAGWVVGLVPAVILLGAPAALLALSVVDSTVLTFADASARGVSLQWYRHLFDDPGWARVMPATILTWSTAAFLAVGGGLAAMLGTRGRPKARSAMRLSLGAMMFIPHNALGVIAFWTVQMLPDGIANRFPGWALAGTGQALPALPLAFLLIDRSLDGVERSLKVAASIGAGPIRRLYQIVLPRAAPGVIAALLVTALISLDDIVFVRYVPRGTVNTLSTELYSRVLYSASPDLAALSVLTLISVLCGAAFALLVLRRRALPAWRRRAARVWPAAGPQVDITGAGQDAG